MLAIFMAARSAQAADLVKPPAAAEREAQRPRRPDMRLVVALAALAAACGPAKASGPLAIQALAASTAAPIAVRLTSPDDQGALARRHSSYGANVSPPLAWTEAAGARAYALVLEDPDAHGPRPFVHWLIWNLPRTSLPEGVPSGGSPGRPQGAVQGASSAGQTGYYGPHPPSGTHHYHFEVFALDAPLALAPGADIAAFEKAAAGHVLARGETVATFAAPP
jgi:Raf kinase inhibitor-like YbhB/YbcL family protein